MSDWNSKQYMRFEIQRTQPSIDLINRIELNAPARILDIGCGPGNGTINLKKRFPMAEIIGIDSSENMLDKARNDYKDIEFLKCSVPNELNIIEGKFDLIFSNACIHWIPDQKKLISTVMSMLNKNGVFAVQIPLVQEAPFYKMLNNVLEEPMWNEKLRHIKNFHNLNPEQYYDLLSSMTDDFEIWQTTYYHVVNSYSGILEWYKGSGLRPYIEALNDDEKVRFTAELESKLSNVYHTQADGNVILKMPRMFFIANN